MAHSPSPIADHQPPPTVAQLLSFTLVALSFVHSLFVGGYPGMALALIALVASFFAGPRRSLAMFGSLSAFIFGLSAIVLKVYADRLKSGG